MLMNDYIDEISTGKSRLKRSVRATEESFPLMIIDKSKNKMVGIFDNERDLKKILIHTKRSIQIQTYGQLIRSTVVILHMLNIFLNGRLNPQCDLD